MGKYPSAEDVLGKFLEENQKRIDEARLSGEWEDEFRINIMPYVELQSGEESIHDHIDPDQVVPEEVIEYLKHGEFRLVCMGIYPHPFEPDVRLCGPYWYGDDKYEWDRDAWKYASKYHVELPQEFIDHVLSEDGQKWLEEHKDLEPGQGHKALGKMVEGHGLNLTPKNDGDVPIDKF